MNELKWLDNYSGESTEELISFEGEYRTDSIILAFEQALDQKADNLGKDSLTYEELVILAVEALEREINNGGYNQFFFNSSSEYASMIVDALQLIGCHDIAEITQQAIDHLEIDGPLSADAIEMVMEEGNELREDQLSECDEQYYDLAGDLSFPLIEFIKNNNDKIDLSSLN